MYDPHPEHSPDETTQSSASTSTHEVYVPVRALSPKQHREPVPESLLRRVRQYSGRLSTEAVKVMEGQLPFVAELDAKQRAGIQDLVQTGLVNFLEWLKDPDRDVRFNIDGFLILPTDLSRGLTLRQTVEMVRTVMDFLEQWLPALARDQQQLTTLTEAALRFGREMGFMVAAMYATAAESRGAWDTRLEALVVDAVVRGDSGSDLMSRAATLNWDAIASATVLVGTPPDGEGVAVVSDIHAVARQHQRSALAVVQGERLVAVVSGDLSSSHSAAFLSELLKSFSDDAVVIGPTAPGLRFAHASAVEALAGITAVRGWREAPRPAHAADLLPERVLAGDPLARVSLIEQVVTPLEEAGAVFPHTLDAYLDNGGAVENCARQLFVHPNTVRYRLKRITEITGRDPLNARDAYVLRIAQTLGKLTKQGHSEPIQAPATRPSSSASA